MTGGTLQFAYNAWFIPLDLHMNCHIVRAQRCAGTITISVSTAQGEVTLLGGLGFFGGEVWQTGSCLGLRSPAVGLLLLPSTGHLHVWPTAAGARGQRSERELLEVPHSRGEREAQRKVSPRDDKNQGSASPVPSVHVLHHTWHPHGLIPRLSGFLRGIFLH